MRYSYRFRAAGKHFKLKHVDPDFHWVHEGEDAARQEIAECRERLAALQYRMYAENRRSLLVCLQAMDAGGKDGTIQHVMGAMNPQGCRVAAFKTPSAEEAAHDFLWREHRALGGKGTVSVFNRSHYEEVLTTRVHGLISKAECSRRYEEINAFEKMLVENGTHILKFFLHIGKEEQLARFKARLEDPAKQWKISEKDYRERELWDDYMHAYERMIRACSTKHAPWYVIPANHKWFRNLAVSQILVEQLESLNMKLPQPTVDLSLIRRRYHRAKKEEARRRS